MAPNEPAWLKHTQFNTFQEVLDEAYRINDALNADGYHKAWKKIEENWARVDRAMGRLGRGNPDYDEAQDSEDAAPIMKGPAKKELKALRKLKKRFINDEEADADGSGDEFVPSDMDVDGEEAKKDDAEEDGKSGHSGAKERKRPMHEDEEGDEEGQDSNSKSEKRAKLLDKSDAKSDEEWVGWDEDEAMFDFQN
ncbi:unnamed protein product [Clonostachys rosea]|uniref:Uncharacterized protein n=1 Tax=Bionectria ochroleuca TaxID=29856 RepID=A0ABY6U2W3_BIOOC|nr:unnamed protein product [Clonostachys rosea]